MGENGTFKRFLPSRRKLLWSVGVYLVSASLIMFAGCADRLILFPSTHAIREPGITRDEVKPTRDGAKPIEIWTARSPGAVDAEPQAYCLEFNGNAARAEWVAPHAASQWESHPVEAWSMNYPGYGGSPGPAKLASIPPAALAAYDALAQKANGKPIFILGQSLGTMAALHVAANRKCAGLILTNPPPLRNLILGKFGWWNLWLIAGPVALSIPSELDSLANAKKVTVPAVFVLAGRDSVVPPKYQNKVFDAYAGDKLAVRDSNADHNDPLEGAGLQQYQQALEWLWNRAGIPQPSTAPASR